MSRWFRHYAGMMRDDKLVSVAVKSQQPVERVVWVWGSLLESAAEINEGGRFVFDINGAAYFLRCEAPDLEAIVNALCDLGRIEDGKVTKWSDRQFESDGSRDRQQRYRDRKKTSRDGVVTSPGSDVTAQETETETETETERAKPPDSVLDAEGARDIFKEIWSVFPQNPSSSDTKARLAFGAIKAEEHSALLAAALRYRAWFGEDCKARKREVVAGLRFVPHLATWIETGAWREAGTLPIKADEVAKRPVVALARLHRDWDAKLWQECERLTGKEAPTNGLEWSFPAEIVEAARQALSTAA